MEAQVEVPEATRPVCTKSMSQTSTSAKDLEQTTASTVLLPTKELTQLLKSRMAPGVNSNQALVGLTSAQPTAPMLEPHQGDQVLLAAVLLLALLTRPERTRSMWMNSIFGKVLGPITERMAPSKIRACTRSRRFRMAHGEN